MEPMPILHISLKFQVDHACFQRWEVSADFSGKVWSNKKEKEADRRKNLEHA